MRVVVVVDGEQLRGVTTSFISVQRRLKTKAQSDTENASLFAEPAVVDAHGVKVQQSKRRDDKSLDDADNVTFAPRR